MKVMIAAIYQSIAIGFLTLFIISYTLRSEVGKSSFDDPMVLVILFVGISFGALAIFRFMGLNKLVDQSA